MARCYRSNFNQRITMNDMEAGMGALLEDCCARDIASSQGLGCDNMTAIIVEINQNKK